MGIKQGLLPIILLIMLLFPISAAAAEDLSGIDAIAEELDAEFAVYEDYFSIEVLWQQIKAGELAFDLQGIWQLLLHLFLDEAAGCGRLLAELAIIGIMAVLLENLTASFGGGLSAAAQGAIYMLLVGIAIIGFKNTAAIAADAINHGSDFLYALLPMLMTFVAALGGLGTVSLMSPALLFALTAVTGLISQIIFPLIYLAAVMKLLTCLSPRFNVDKLAKLCRSFALGSLSICSGIFIAFLSIGGIASASVGGLAVKAAKAAGGLFIPVVGKSLADALDSVIGVSLVLKNGIGLFGVIAILLYIAYPAVKILVISLLYKLTGAVLEPMGSHSAASALYEIGGVIQSLFAVVAIGGVFFFFVLAITIGMGNITMMMR